jgi:hypothetical protein
LKLYGSIDSEILFFEFLVNYKNLLYYEKTNEKKFLKFIEIFSE